MTEKKQKLHQLKKFWGQDKNLSWVWKEIYYRRIMWDDIEDNQVYRFLMWNFSVSGASQKDIYKLTVFKCE